MILDAIVALFGSLFAMLLDGVALLLLPLVNFLAAGVEALIGLFVAGFSLGRIERKPSERRYSARAALVTLLLVVGTIGCAFAVPKLLNRQVTLVARDGHSLPFAAVTIRTSDGDRHARTDDAGHVTVPRFATESLTIKDARYVEHTWTGAELEAQLIVDRTVLGKGLDALADHLMKPAQE